jgi:dihydroorotate dehydrogenase
MGFNNQGVDHLIANVNQAHFRGILGINLGKNFDTPLANAVTDYVIGLQKVYRYASYVTINISSPNTPGLRQLQQEDELDHLLRTLKQEQQSLTQQYEKYVPLVLKIAPDLTESEVEHIAHKLLDYQIDGVIATNTTLSRVGVENLPHATERGGLSGAPLTQKATQIVKQLHEHLQGKIPIIAAGGIMTANDALAKFRAGASLVQLYTGLIYRGPALLKEIVNLLRVERWPG